MKKGSKHSQETKIKLSKIHKGCIPWNKGKRKTQVAWNKGKKCFQFTGMLNPSWKGGRIKRQDGYIEIYQPDHPTVIYKKSIYKHPKPSVFEHRLVMEKILGRYLTKNEIIHHKNSIRDDNRPENLFLTVKGKNWHPHICPKCGFEFLIA